MGICLADQADALQFAKLQRSGWQRLGEFAQQSSPTQLGHSRRRTRRMRHSLQSVQEQLAVLGEFIIQELANMA